MSYMMFAQVAIDQLDDDDQLTEEQHKECEQIFYEIVTTGDRDNFVVKKPNGTEYAFCLWLSEGEPLEAYLKPFCDRLRPLGFKLRAMAYEPRDVEFTDDGKPTNYYGEVTDE